MKNIVLALVALVLGMLLGNWLVRYPTIHRFGGRTFHRGELVALVGDRAIFEADVQARAEQNMYCSGTTAESLERAEKVMLRDQIVADEALRMVAGKADGSAVAGEVADIEHQFGDDHQ